MKISILLPYKENFSPEYAGAVSLFVKDTTNISNFKKSINVYGNTSYTKGFNINYKNLNLNRKFLNSTTKLYIKSFLDVEKNNKSDLIEVHNRPIYVRRILENINTNIVLYYHNDPLSMNGSKSDEERLYLLNNCNYIIVISEWIKNRFLYKLNIDDQLVKKLIVIPHSTKKIKNLNLINKKKEIIIFVGKLNSQKGYDLFGNVIIKILNKNKNWRSIVVGDEEREKLTFSHPRLNVLGFIQHNKVIKLFEKSSIAVVPSKWQEPLGRTGLEASSRGCATIVSNRGGLPETITNGIILKKLTESELFKQIQFLINNKDFRQKLQINSIKNFKLDHKIITKKIDYVRKKIQDRFKFNINKNSKLKIIHITNFNQRYFGRLHFNTGTRINNGLIRLGHNILSLSDRDLVTFSKSIKDYTGSKYLNSIVEKTVNNFRPDLVIIGHADKVNTEMLGQLKSKYSNLKIAQWFLDPLTKKGPDYSKNKGRILDKSKSIDASFITTDPKSLDFKINNSFFIPNPCDSSLDNLKIFNSKPDNDMFYAISHGVHRGILRPGKLDERELFIRKLLKHCKDTNFDIYGMFNRQPIWGHDFLEKLSNSKMGLNLSRGKPVKYYSSDRIAQLIGNGLLTFIDTKTKYGDFFTNNEIIFYDGIDDLSQKIKKYKKNDKDWRRIAKNGYKKYHKYFNSNIVARFIIDKTLGIRSKYYWENKS